MDEQMTSAELVDAARMLQTVMTTEPSAEGLFLKLHPPRQVSASYGLVSLGNGTCYTMAFVALPGAGTLVAIERRGAAVFSKFVSTAYAAEKLGLQKADAGNVADLINQRLGVYVPAEKQGTYQPRYCLGGEQDGEE